MSEHDINPDDGPRAVEGANIVDPSGIGSDAVAPEPTSRRKRRSDAGVPRGSKSSSGARKASQAKGAVDLSSLTGMFIGMHATLAGMTNTPELMIAPEEGDSFMLAAQNVMRHYDVKTNQKTVDWIAFMGACGSIYGTRTVAIMMRHRQEQAQRGAVERPQQRQAPQRARQQPSPELRVVPDEIIIPAGEL